MPYRACIHSAHGIPAAHYRPCASPRARVRPPLLPPLPCPLPEGEGLWILYQLVPAITSAATPTAAATAATTPAAGAARTEVAPFHRTRFIDSKSASINFTAVKLSNRFLGSLVVGH